MQPSMHRRQVFAGGGLRAAEDRAEPGDVGHVEPEQRHDPGDGEHQDRGRDHDPSGISPQPGTGPRNRRCAHRHDGHQHQGDPRPQRRREVAVAGGEIVLRDDPRGSTRVAHPTAATIASHPRPSLQPSPHNRQHGQRGNCHRVIELDHGAADRPRGPGLGEVVGRPGWQPPVGDHGDHKRGNVHQPHQPQLAHATPVVAATSQRSPPPH